MSSPAAICEALVLIASYFVRPACVAGGLYCLLWVQAMVLWTAFEPPQLPRVSATAKNVAAVGFFGLACVLFTLALLP